MRLGAELGPIRTRERINRPSLELVIATRLWKLKMSTWIAEINLGFSHALMRFVVYVFMP